MQTAALGSFQDQAPLANVEQVRTFRLLVPQIERLLYGAEFYRARRG